MSKENAEQLLNSVMQDEKDVQDKVKKQQKVLQGGRLEKDLSLIHIYCFLIKISCNR